MKLLIGGSPCTHWSIAQTKNRETEASGIGWELFLNYRIARDKYQPDFFLYENKYVTRYPGADHGGAGRGTRAYQFRAGERAEPPAALLGRKA